MLPNHFYCEGGVAAGCPTVRVPYSGPGGFYIADKYSYVAHKYEVFYE